MIFPTGLTGAEFARQKLSYLLTLRGCVLCRRADGASFSYEEWQAEGIKEENGLMSVFGKDGGGNSNRLDRLLENGSEDTLEAAYLWKAGLDFLQEKTIFKAISIAPCAVFIDVERQTLFFPPHDLIRIVVEAKGQTAWLEGAKRWMHPDREGANAVNWTFAACLYRIFAGFAPFTVPTAEQAKGGAKINAIGGGKSDWHVIEDTLAEDLREGVLIPVSLAAPGLQETIADFIDAHILRNDKKRPGLPPCPVIDHNREKNFTVLTAEALSLIKTRREAIEQKKQKRINTKRFFFRNKTLIKGIAAGVVALGIVVGSFIQGQMTKWSTKGLSPAEVVATYYDAFGTLDHETMSACVEQNAGKTDVEMVTHLFVTSKIREAYEQKRTVINAADWNGTPPPSDTAVFGVVRLATDWPGGGANGEAQTDTVTARARYDLIIPQSFVADADSAGESPVEENATIAYISRDDTLQLQWQRDRWRIAKIDRRERF
jgi:hypothetical protein